MLPAFIISLALLGLSGALLDSHRRTWRAARDAGNLPDRVKRYVLTQYRRRMQASGMIGVIGAAICLWPLVPREPGPLAFYTAKDRRWSIARLSEAGEARLKTAASDRSDDWRGLSVAILHRLVMDTLLKATNLPKPTYVHLVDEVVQELQSGDYPLTALVQPPSLDQIQAVSRHLERMPAKSTYFYPKLASGLLFAPFDE